MIPERIGKYAVIELLGRGGMGEVYLAEDPYIGRRVAIKIIKGADPAARERFLREARVIGGLAHPAIVALLDFDFSGSEPFLVMEYLKGQGLDAWIKNPHSRAEQLVVLEDLCQALAYAHDNGVLHRDVKPSNVQILPSGHAKLMDFGIASAAAQRLTATGSVMGTPEYMAPEILGDAAYSTQSDLYAAGVLLYEMFTGVNPFAAKTVAATLTNVLSVNPPDIRLTHPEFPGRLAETLMACLHKNPELRPDGFAALLAAARDASGAPSSPPPETRAIPVPSSPERVPPAPARPVRKPLRIGVGLGVVALVLFALSRALAPSSEPVGSMTSPRASPAPTKTPNGPTPMEPAASPPGEPAVSPAPGRLPPTPRPTPASPRVASRPMAAEPSPTPSAPAESTPAPVLPTPEPPRPAPVRATPAPTIAAEPITAEVRATSLSPRTLRRGESVVLEVRGDGLPEGVTASIFQGRRPAAGIRVLRVEFVSPRLVRVSVLSDPELPLGGYTLILRDRNGVTSPGLQIEVVL